MDTQEQPITATHILCTQFRRNTHCIGKEYSNLVYLKTEFLAQCEWWIEYLDVYFHPESDTCAGILHAKPVMDDRGIINPGYYIVQVEIDPIVHYRVEKGKRKIWVTP